MKIAVVGRNAHDEWRPVLRLLDVLTDADTIAHTGVRGAGTQIAYWLATHRRRGKCPAVRCYPKEIHEGQGALTLSVLRMLTVDGIARALVYFDDTGAEEDVRVALAEALRLKVPAYEYEEFIRERRTLGETG